MSWETLANQRLRQIEGDALDRYATDHPDWEKTSHLMALEQERGHKLCRVRYIRETLAKAEAQVCAVNRAIETMRGTVTE